MTTAPQIIVIGAGIIGLGCAYTLLRAGVSVAVLDTVDNQSASQQAAGALRPFDANRNTRKANLQRQSLLMYPAFIQTLAQYSKTDTEYHACQRLVIADSPHIYTQLKHKAEQAANHWPRVDEQVAQMMLPGVDVPPPVHAPHGALLCRHSACINPLKLLQALREAVLTLGGEILHRTASKVEEKDGHVIVHLKGGKHLTADHAVIAAGAESKHLVSSLSQIHLHARYRQALTVRAPESVQLTTMLEGQGVYLVPRADGRHIYIGAEDLPPWANGEADAAVTDKLLKAAIALLPALEKAEITEIHVGRVPRMARGEPMLIGVVPHHQRTFIAAGHGGVGYGLMPLTAEAITQLVTTGKCRFSLPEF